MKWIFLDFGSYHLKALKAQVENTRIRIEDFGTWDTKPEHFEGLGMPTEAAWKTFSTGLDELGWLKTEEDLVVSSSLPSGYLESRYLRFPFASDKKIEKVLNFELEPNIPFDLEEMLIRHRVIKGPGVEDISPQSMVMILAYKREYVKTFEAHLRAFQLSIPALSTENLNMICLRQLLPPEPVQALLHIGHSKSLLSIFQQNGTPLALKTFYWGAKSMQKHLQTDLKVDEKRALELFIENASFEVSTDSQSIHIRMAEALENSLSEFMDELRQCLKGLQHLGLELPRPFPVYLMGSATRCPGLSTRLEERFRAEFETTIRPFPMERIQEHVDGLHLLEDPLSALPCLALALSQIRANRNKVESFSESNFRLQQNIQRLRSGTQEVLRRVGLLLIAPFIFLVLSFIIGHQEKSKIEAQIQQQLIRNNFEVKEGLSLNETKEELFKAVRELKQKSRALKEDEGSPVEILANVSRAIPSSLKIDLTEFKVSDDKISLSGETDSAQTSSKILQELQKIYPTAKKTDLQSCTSYDGCQAFNIEFNRETQQK